MMPAKPHGHRAEAAWVEVREVACLFRVFSEMDRTHTLELYRTLIRSFQYRY